MVLVFGISPSFNNSMAWTSTILIQEYLFKHHFLHLTLMQENTKCKKYIYNVYKK